MTIKMGMTARDTITGFQGVVTGLCHYLTECSQALVQPPVDKQGNSRDARWIDVQRLKQVGSKIVVLDNSATPGFDLAPPVR